MSKTGTLPDPLMKTMGVYFHRETPAAVKKIILEHLCHDLFHLKHRRQHRLFFDMGDAETGQSWGEVYGCEGYVGRSTGTQPVPLILHNSNSMGGGAILDHCIVRIRTTRAPHKELYQHPTYRPPEIDFEAQHKVYSDVVTGVFFDVDRVADQVMADMKI